MQNNYLLVLFPTTGFNEVVAQAYLDSDIYKRLVLDQSRVSNLDNLPFLRDLLPDNFFRRLPQI